MADESNRGRQVAAYAIAALSLVIAYQSWQNASYSDEILDLSHEAAMTISTVDEHRPRMERYDPVRKRYEWHTDVGPVIVRCRRDLIFFGDWTCTPTQGRMGSF